MIDRRPRPRPDVEAVEVDGELVLWDPVLQRVHHLDPVGTLLWQVFDGTVTIAELADDVAEVWSTDRASATAALTALVEQLDAARLLVHEDGSLDDGPVAPARPRYLADPPAP